MCIIHGRKQLDGGSGRLTCPVIALSAAESNPEAEQDKDKREEYDEDGLVVESSFVVVVVSDEEEEGGGEPTPFSRPKANKGLVIHFSKRNSSGVNLGPAVTVDDSILPTVINVFSRSSNHGRANVPMVPAGLIRTRSL